MSQNEALKIFLMSQNGAFGVNSNVAKCSIKNFFMHAKLGIKPLKCIKCFIIYVKHIKI